MVEIFCVPVGVIDLVPLVDRAASHSGFLVFSVIPVLADLGARRVKIVNAHCLLTLVPCFFGHPCSLLTIPLFLRCGALTLLCGDA